MPRVRRDSSTRAEGRSVDAGAVGAENARTKQPRFESDHGGTGWSNSYSAANEKLHECVDDGGESSKGLS